ncbi:MAG: hypothetical protein V4508_03420 [Pseudomonadota bacterium]
MSNELFNGGQRDFLAEMVNIAMGKTASALAEALDAQVNLQAPVIRMASVDPFETTLRADLRQGGAPLRLVQQGFLGELAGYAGLISGAEPEPLSPALGSELLMAFVRHFAQMLGMRCSLCPPQARGAGSERQGDAGQTLLIEIRFLVEGRAQPCDLLVALLPECLPALRRALVCAA